MTDTQFDYDWLVIGSGPAGEKGAVQAAYFGRRVAVVEREPVLGGACVHTGTLPSKTLRETAVHLSGFRSRAIYSVDCQVRAGVTVGDLMARLDAVLGTEERRIRDNLARHKVDLLTGTARFEDAHTVALTDSTGGVRRVTAGAFLIATGSRPFRPDYVPFDDPQVSCSDSILKLDRVPTRLVVLGGGVIGCEYATIFAALGTQVVIVEGRDTLLGFLDDEITALLTAEMGALGCEVRLNRKVQAVERREGDLVCVLDDGEVLVCERLLFAGGRNGNTLELGLETLGVRPNSRGLLDVEPGGRVKGAPPNIFAAGDVVGFPALASVAMEQGRVAACHAFDLDYKRAVAPLFPYGLYTIPEVAMVGQTEEDARAAGLDVEVGRARYGQLARGQIIGDVTGLLKLVFAREDRRLLGVHILGERATELIHVGQTVMHMGGRIDAFIELVFNFPTLGELYKYAAYDGLGRLAASRKA